MRIGILLPILVWHERIPHKPDRKDRFMTLSDFRQNQRQDGIYMVLRVEPAVLTLGSL
jgi:hypothetical protein